jgi:hypothetical protein
MKLLDNNTEVHLQEIELEGVDLVRLLQNKDYGQEFWKTVVKLRVPQMGRDFLAI